MYHPLHTALPWLGNGLGTTVTKHPTSQYVAIQMGKEEWQAESS